MSLPLDTCSEILISEPKELSDIMQKRIADYRCARDSWLGPKGIRTLRNVRWFSSHFMMVWPCLTLYDVQLKQVRIILIEVHPRSNVQLPLEFKVECANRT